MFRIDRISMNAASFLLGGMIAATVALLYAPQSGEKTRKEINSKALQARKQALMGIEDAKERLVEAADELQDKSQSLIKSLNDEFHYKGTRLKRIGSAMVNEQKSSLEHGAKDALYVLKS